MNIFWRSWKEKNNGKSNRKKNIKHIFSLKDKFSKTYMHNLYAYSHSGTHTSNNNKIHTVYTYVHLYDFLSIWMSLYQLIYLHLSIHLLYVYLLNSLSIFLSIYSASAREVFKTKASHFLDSLRFLALSFIYP